MNIQRLFDLPIVVACCVLGVVQAQQPATPTQVPASIESQAQQPYLLGPGDVLEVTVDQMTNPTRRVQVNGDGYISALPFIDPVKAKCRTERQVQNDITTAYDK